MELKSRIGASPLMVMQSINRTFMELKYSEMLEMLPDKIGINRTFMELKFDKNFSSVFRTPSINRTFMELKCVNVMAGVGGIVY
jgi:hypothetical protein